MRRWFSNWGPGLVVMAAIFAASAVPDAGPLPADVSDKTAHFAAYGLLGALLARGWAAGRWAGYTWLGACAASAMAAAYGATDEWHQSFVPGRSPEVADWIADAAGAVAGALAATLVARIQATRSRAV